mgnify:CR=1 FL=1
MSAIKFERVTAGAEVNVAVALARLGLKAQYFSRFGNDQLGSVMLADIEAEGVDVSLSKRVDSFTGAMVRNPGKTAPVEISYLRKGSAASTIEPGDILDSYIKKIINSNDGAVKLLMQNIDQLQSSNLSDKYKLEEKLLKKLLDE